MVGLLVSVCVCVCVCVYVFESHQAFCFVCFSFSFFYEHMQAVWPMDPNYKCIHYLENGKFFINKYIL